MTDRLPIDDILETLTNTLSLHRRAVLQAPPGAGKTTRVPPALLRTGLSNGRIILLEPRRLAARAAAERMAFEIGDPVGGTVGYRIRGEVKISRATQIEVVTEGILTRMLQDAPDLPGVGAVIFDEFHERSLNADLGLALCLEVASALRDDLILMAMSATLDAAPVAALMQAPVITARGRSFPVETIWLDRPLAPRADRISAMADLLIRAETETRSQGGGILAFLPGEGEIRRLQARLADAVPKHCETLPLYGALPLAEQRHALTPAPKGRRIILATSIAETSLTLPGIRTVVDGGQTRRARFDPGSGMSRLITERITRAEAEQRRGRAGRVAKGLCYRLWSRGEEGALAAFPPAEIEATDLTALALELACWGGKASDLPFLTQPPVAALTKARALLSQLGALDARGRITPHGRTLASLPLHPRLGHMLTKAGRSAADLAALLAERDPLRGAPVDLLLRLEALRNPTRFERERGFSAPRPAIDRIKREAQRLTRAAGQTKSGLSVAAMAALAYPDRIGQRRPGDAPRFRLSGGKGAVLDASDPLAGAPFIVAADTDGDRREARIRLAAQITEAELRALWPDRIEWRDSCMWSSRDRRVVARRQECLGALVLEDRIWKDAPQEALARAMLDGVRDLGLRLDGAAGRLARRVELLRAQGADLPDFTDAALMERLESWLLPFLEGVRDAAGWRAFDPLPALEAALSWDQRQLLDREAPPNFKTPLGRKVPVDYEAEGPAIALRLQELFGTKTHPNAAGQPIRITLLSPANRPVQVTRDLPGFWSGTYADVRKDMRARYPKHPWPEDPTQADPTLRAKPRKR